ncbi:MAG: helix-turn-helix transcriptional regulator [Bacilli bacterium]
MENNLKKLREINDNMTQQQLAEELDLSIQMIKKYEGGDRISIETALNIQEKFDVSLDWIYCKSPYMNERDTMSDILFSLTKILKLGRRKTNFGDDNVLVIDSRFREFLFDINGLASSRYIYLDMSDETYNALRKDIFNRHANNLRQIFSDVEYLDSNATEIHKIETSHDFNYDELFDVLAEPKIEDENTIE